jgi:hypothetical protein
MGHRELPGKLTRAVLFSTKRACFYEESPTSWENLASNHKMLISSQEEMGKLSRNAPLDTFCGYFCG